MKNVLKTLSFKLAKGLIAPAVVVGLVAVSPTPFGKAIRAAALSIAPTPIANLALSQNILGSYTGAVALPEVLEGTRITFDEGRLKERLSVGSPTSVRVSNGLISTNKGPLTIAPENVIFFFNKENSLSSGGALQLSGPITASSLYSTGDNLYLNGDNAYVTDDGIFTGNGSGLSSLKADQITSGTLSDDRLSSNVSRFGDKIDSGEIQDGTIKKDDIASDTIDLDNIADTLPLDNSLEFTLRDHSFNLNANGTGNVNVDLRGTGSFRVQDNTGSVFFTLGPDGTITQAGSGTVTFSGNTTLSANLTVSGSSTFTGPSTFVGAVTPSTFTGHLLPTTTSIYDLGSNSLQWRDLYISGTIASGNLNLSAANPTISFTDTTTGEEDWNINVDGSTFFIRNTTDGSNYLSIDSSGSTTISSLNTGVVYNTSGVLTSEAQLSVTRGGTGASTITGLIQGNGASAFTAVTTSLGIAGNISDETGSGSLVFGTSPTLDSPTVTGTGDIQATLSNSTGNITINDATDISGTTTVGGGYGSTGVTISSSGDIQLDGNLTVGGTATFNGLVTNNSNTTLGDSAADTITFVGVVNSNITPETNNTYSLGTAAKRWSTGYFNTVDATTIVGVVAGGSTSSNTWTINSDNATANAEIGALAFETGSNPINAVLQWNASGDVTKISGYDDSNLFNYPISLYSEVSGANQTFTSGSLFKYGQNATHAITQSGAFIGTDLNFSSNITVPNSANGNQTGAKVTLKDGGASATAIGFQTAGTMDYGLDIGGTIGTADIRLSNGETISNTTDGTISLAATTISFPSATSFTASSATASFDTLNVGGGYGSTGVTISSAGAISTNSTLTVDSTATIGTGLTVSSGGFGVTGDSTLNGFLAITNASLFMAGNVTPSASGNPQIYRNNTGDLNLASRSDGTARDIIFRYGSSFTPSMTIKDGGNVGIGITNPASKLNVVHSSLANNGDTNVQIDSTASMTGNPTVYGTNNTLTLGSGAASATGTGIALKSSATVSATSNIPTSAIAFATASNHTAAGTLTTQMEWQTGPSATAGTTTNLYHAQFRDVYTNSGAGAVTRQAGLAIEGFSSAANNTLALIGTTTIPTGNYGIYNASTYNNYFAGSVGIGITNPGATLEIKGTDGSNMLKVSASAGGSASLSYLTTGGGASSALYLDRGAQASGDQQFVWRTSGTDKWYIGRRASDNTESLFFRDSSSNVNLALAQGGNVGIGTTGPSSILHIASDNPVLQVVDSNSTIRQAALNLGTAGGNWYLQTGFSSGTDSNLHITRALDGSDVKLTIDRTSGNVGIGTTNPSNAKLEVSATSALARFTGNSTDAYISIFNDATGADDWHIINAEGASAGSGLSFWNATDSQARLVLHKDGNVGIGITNPGTKLHVVGGIYSGTTSPTVNTGTIQASSQLVVGTSFAGSGFGNISVETPINTLTTIFDAGEGSRGAYMSLLENGANTTNFAIGTRAGSTNTERFAINSNVGSDTGSFVFNETGADFDFRIESDTDANAIFLDAGNNRIGFGTGSPSYKFQIGGAPSGTVMLGVVPSSLTSGDIMYYGSGPAVTGTYDLVNIGGSATTGVSAIFNNSNSSSTNAHTKIQAITTGASAGDPYLALTVSGVVDWTLGVDNSDADKFKIGPNSVGSSTALTIDTSGNVGIGVVTPGKTLHVAGGGIFGAEDQSWVFDDSASRRLGFVKKAGAYTALVAASGAPMTFSRSSASDLTSAVSGQTLTTSMLIDSSGNIGIADSSPESILDINSSSDQYVKLGTIDWGMRLGQLQAGQQFISLGVKKTAANNSYIAETGNNAAVEHLIFELDYNGAFRFKAQAHAADDATLSPTEVMTIQRNGNVGIGTTGPGAKLDISDNSGGAPSLRITNSAASAWTRLIGASTSNFIDSDDALFFRTGASYITAMAIDTAGNVGIGTTDPKTLLHVYGHNGATPSTYATTSSSGMARFLTNDNVFVDIGALGASPWSGWIQVGDTAAGAYYPLGLNPNGGNVGVGTTSPSYTLDVNGTVNASTALRIAGQSTDLRYSRVYQLNKNITAGNTQPLARFRTSPEGVISVMIQVQSTTSAHSGTKQYLFQGGYHQLGASFPGSWYKMQPLAVGRGHGDSTAGFDVYVRAGTDPYEYDFAVSAVTNNKTLITTFTDLTGGNMTYTDISSGSAVATSSAGDIYSHRSMNIEGNVAIGTPTANNRLQILSDNSSQAIQFNVALHVASQAWGTRMYTSDIGNGIPLKFEAQQGTNWFSAVDIGHGQHADHPSLKTYYETNLAVTSGNVGIGTTTPTVKLDVVGSSAFDTNTLFVDSVNDRVGIGTTGPSSTFEITLNKGDAAGTHSRTSIIQPTFTTVANAGILRASQEIYWNMNAAGTSNGINVGLRVGNPSITTATVPTYASLMLDANGTPSGVTNHTYLLMGTTTVPTGQYALYSAATLNKSYLAGGLQVDGNSTTGFLGIGTASHPANALRIIASTSGSSNEVGVYANNTVSSSSTTYGTAFLGSVAGSNTGTYGTADMVNFLSDSMTKGTNQTITNAKGIWVKNQGSSIATNAYGLYIDAITAGSSLNLGIYNGGSMRTGNVDVSAMNSGGFGQINIYPNVAASGSNRMSQLILNAYDMTASQSQQFVIAASRDTNLVSLGVSAAGGGSDMAMSFRGGQMYLKTDGTVGIGTTSPNTLVDVRGGTFSLSNANVTHGVTSIIATNNFGYMTALNATSGGLITVGLSDTDSAATALNLTGIIGTESSAVPAIVISGSQKSGTNQAALSATSQLLSVRNNNSTDLFTILAGGSVGVGTSSPDVRSGIDILKNLNATGYSGQYGLHVRPTMGTAATAETRGINVDLTLSGAFTTASNYSVFINNPTKSGGAAITTNYGLFIADQTAGATNYALYSTGGTNYFGGNVGIGTTSPSAPLHVSGTSAIFGAGNAGTPTATTIKGAAASGTHIAGADMTFDASNGTGAGNSGAFIFRTAATGITLDNATTSSSGSQNFSFSYTVGTGSKRVLIVGITMRFNSGSAGQATGTSMTYNGVALTKLTTGTEASQNASELWYLVNPASGSNTLAINLSGAAESVVGVQSYYGVDQVNPVGTPASANGASTTPSVNVTSATNELVVDHVGINHLGAPSVSVGASQTLRYGPSTNVLTTAAGSSEPGAGTTTMSWTITSNPWTIVAVALKPYAGGAATVASTTADTLTERFRIDPNGTATLGTSVVSNLPPGSLHIANGALCVDNGGNTCKNAARTAGNIYAKSTTITGVDLAENYPSKDTTLEAGELIAVDANNPEYITRATNNKGLLGVVSTTPGITLGAFGDAETKYGNDKQYPIALAGRVPVKVTTENGEIQPGDYLTISSTPGVAMKATRPGQVIGKALQGFNQDGIGSVIVFVGITFADPNSALAQLSIDENGNLLADKAFTALGKITAQTYAVAPITNVSLAAENTQSASGSALLADAVFQDLSRQVTEQASASASLAQRIKQLEDNFLMGNVLAASTSAALTEAEDLKVTNDLTVLNKTKLYDVSIIGTLRSGVMTIDGADGSITALTDITFQNRFGEGLSIDIRGNVKTVGSITAEEVKTHKLKITTDPIATSSATLGTSSSIGNGKIESGESSVVIETKAVTANSKIFVTPKTVTDKALAVSEQTEGKSFEVKIASPAPTDIEFYWWIVDEE